ncbi:hypothetical protein MHBO_002866 [Bonamia ostreae]|uniref:Uncharacterized protein n=1 Tax=Bonamia ostreae TaxID=126728 RepID=A0ABV2APR2_9EUKA
MKHDSGSSGCFDRYAGKVYNILSIVYTVLLSVVIFTKVCRGFKEVLLQKYLFVGILFSNFSFLLDTIFSETEELFDYGDSKETNNATYCNYIQENTDRIKKYDPLFSLGAVEFAILTIDMLFTTIQKQTAETRNVNDSQQNQPNEPTATGPTETGNLKYKKNGLVCLIPICVALSIILLVVSILAFNADSRHPDESESWTLSTPFKIYIITSSVIKFIMSVSLTLCIITSWHSFRYKFNVDGLILMTSLFGNIIYHMFYLFASLKDNPQENAYIYLVFTYFDNICSIIVAAQQTQFILAIENGENIPKTINERTVLVRYCCLILFILNIGLWAGDTLGEANATALSIIIKRNYGDVFWIIFTKLVLPFTIFFRIHSGLIMLKMFRNLKGL